MFRVPTSPENPTYDDTFKVSFWRWLTSSKQDRKEWMRRRNAAIPTSRSIRYLKEKEAQAEARANQWQGFNKTP